MRAPNVPLRAHLARAMLLSEDCNRVPREETARASQTKAFYQGLPIELMGICLSSPAEENYELLTHSKSRLAFRYRYNICSKQLKQDLIVIMIVVYILLILYAILVQFTVISSLLLLSPSFLCVLFWRIFGESQTTVALDKDLGTMEIDTCRLSRNGKIIGYTVSQESFQLAIGSTITISTRLSPSGPVYYLNLMNPSIPLTLFHGRNVDDIDRLRNYVEKVLQAFNGSYYPDVDGVDDLDSKMDDVPSC